MAVKIIETNLQFRGALQKRSRTDYIVLHHAEAIHASVQDIHRWHLQRGWAGIGYHYYVRKDGNIYRGRPKEVIGAHVKGHNYHSVGICTEGNYMTETMPTAQENAIIALCKELLTVYPNVKIVGHRDLMATACPGVNYPFKEIVQAVYKKEDENVQKTKILFEGKELEGFVIDGKSYAEVRKLCKMLGLKVTWNAQKGIVEVSK